MSNWILLHSTYNDTETWIDLTQVRTMWRGHSHTNQYVPITALSTMTASAPTPMPSSPPPVLATFLVYGKDDYAEFKETPEEILRLAKGVKPQASAFSLEELNAAQDAVEAATPKAVPGNSAWQQMWATPYEPQPEKETT